MLGIDSCGFGVVESEERGVEDGGLVKKAPHREMDRPGTPRCGS